MGLTCSQQALVSREVAAAQAEKQRTPPLKQPVLLNTDTRNLAASLQSNTQCKEGCEAQAEGWSEAIGRNH